MIMRRPWTPDDNTMLLELSDTDVTWAAIAKILGRTKSSVGTKLAELRGRSYAVTHKPTADERPRELIEYVRSDHLGHCISVLRANNGCGFPVGGCR